MNQGSLKIVPLAGAEEIGMNMMLYMYEKEGEKFNILVDCGVAFENLPGANVVMPDMQALKDLDVKIDVIVLTHGHEDHIGAIVYLFNEIKAPMYATPFTCGLIKKKFKYSKIKDYELETVQLGESRDLGPFHIQWIAVTHSIPDSAMLAIEVNNTRILHTGDWKLDDEPIVGPVADFEKIEAFGRKGVDIMISDSTNIHEDQTAVSEGEVYRSLEKLVAETKTGKFVLTCFASNVARVKSCLNAAKNAGRKVLILGGSLKKTIEVSLELGYLDGDIIIDEEEANETPANKMMIISTGSQAETNSALWKMANKMRSAGSVLEKGDTLVFSARVIDGRQHEVRKVINQLVERGLRIMHPWNSQESCIHASGHPGKPDIEKLLNSVKPQYVIPVHSEAEHRVSHIAFAKSKGYKAFNIRNGMVIEIKKNEKEVTIEKVKTIKSSKVIFDGGRLVHESSDIFRVRRELNANGFIMITVLFKNKKISTIVTNYGVYDRATDVTSKNISLNKQLKFDVDRAISSYGHSDIGHQESAIKKKIIDAAKNSIWYQIKKVPLIGVHFAV